MTHMNFREASIVMMLALDCILSGIFASTLRSIL